VCLSAVPPLQAYLGPPSAAARYEILRSGVLELARAGLISGNSHELDIGFLKDCGSQQQSCSLGIPAAAKGVSMDQHHKKHLHVFSGMLTMAALVCVPGRSHVAVQMAFASSM